MRLSRVLTFAGYEARRAVARKKVLALVALTVLIGVAPYYALAALNETSVITPPLRPYMWILGVFLPQAFFVQFTALLIAAGSMSEEYEQGTAEVLLSKPVSRDEYFFGKYLGGYALLVGILVLAASLTLTSATYVFGAQAQLGVEPEVLLAQALAATVFYSFAFMFGELMRRSSLSYIVSASVFFTCEIIGTVLNVLFSLTGDGIYRTVNVYLPTSAVDSLPLMLAEPNFSGSVSPIFRLGPLATPVEPSVLAAALLVAAYAITAVSVALLYFGRADVSKRVT